MAIPGEKASKGGACWSCSYDKKCRLEWFSTWTWWRQAIAQPR